MRFQLDMDNRIRSLTRLVEAEQVILLDGGPLSRGRFPALYGRLCALVALRDMAQDYLSLTQDSYLSYLHRWIETAWNLRASEDYGLPYMIREVDEEEGQKAIKAHGEIQEWGLPERIAFDAAFQATRDLYRWW